MAQQHKYIHQITELLAVILIVPFLIQLLYKYNFKPLDKYFLILFIIATIIIDGYLFFTWFGETEGFENDKKKEMIKKLIRQTSRWAIASLNDKSNLIATLHSNYSLGYWWALNDLFDDDEIDKVLGSKEKRKKIESRLLEIQDMVTKKTVKDCPKFTETIDFLSELAGEA